MADETEKKGAGFPETRWSLIRRVAADGATDSAEGQKALSEICQAYWFPIYAFLRQSGQPPHDAEDSTQDFFARVVSKNLIARADAQFGKLRSFLIGVLKKYLQEAKKKKSAQKRGSGEVPVSIEAAEAEGRLAAPQSGEWSPEESYDFHWAVTLLDAALESLCEDYSAKGKAELFDAVAPSLQGGEMAPYRAAAKDLGMTESAFKVAAHRLRLRFKDAVRAQVAETLDDAKDVEAELGHLRSVLHR